MSVGPGEASSRPEQAVTWLGGSDPGLTTFAAQHGKTWVPGLRRG